MSMFLLITIITIIMTLTPGAPLIPPGPLGAHGAWDISSWVSWWPEKRPNGCSVGSFGHLAWPWGAFGGVLGSLVGVCGVVCPLDG